MAVSYAENVFLHEKMFLNLNVNMHKMRKIETNTCYKNRLSYFSMNH